MLELVVNNEEEDIERPALKPDWMGPIDWLSPMPSGTEFLCRWLVADNKWKLWAFTHGGKLHGNVLLCPTMTLNDDRTWQWVDPIEFCKAWEFRGILEVPDG